MTPLDLPWHPAARLLLAAGDPRLVLLVGEPGTGKSTFAHLAARQATSLPPLVLSGTAETEQPHLFGRWTLAGNETRFLDGPLPAALKSNRWLLIEEFSQIPLECRASLLPLRDQDEITNPLNGEVLPIPPSFRLLATSNSESLSCRRNTGVARVLYDGFFILEVPELTDEQVKQLLKHNSPRAAAKRINRVLELWNDYRGLSAKDGRDGKSQLGFRAAAHLLTLLEAGMDETQGVAVALVNKFLATDPDLFSAAKLKNTVA